MQNKDLSRFFPDNPLSNKAFQFVRYNENGEIEGLVAGEVYIGTLTINHAPTQEELSQFVRDTVDRDPEVNDTIVVVQQVSGGADITSKYTFNGTEWSGYNLPGVELSNNGEAGIVAGTYGVKTYDTLIDIVDGEVRNIYIKDGSGYRELGTFIKANRSDITGILDGSYIVKKAEEDESGNNIKGSYAASLEANNDTLTLKNKNGAQLSQVTVDNVEHANSANTATTAEYDTDGNQIAGKFSEIDQDIDSIDDRLDTIEQEIGELGTSTKQSLEVLNITSNKWISQNAIDGFEYEADIYLGEFTSGPYLDDSHAVVNLIIDPSIAKEYGICLYEIYNQSNTNKYYAKFVSNSKPNTTIVAKISCLWNTDYTEYLQPAEPGEVPATALLTIDGDRLYGEFNGQLIDILYQGETPAPIGQVTDEYGNPVTDEYGNPVTAQ